MKLTANFFQLLFREFFGQILSDAETADIMIPEK